MIDQLVYQANFGSEAARAAAQLEIWQRAQAQGIYSASIYPLYAGRAAEKIPHTFTVPAINLRGLSYHSARAALRAAQAKNVGLLIFELARSEMAYTGQPPAIYASNILAAAIAENWNQPIFIQGDHFQAKAEVAGKAKAGEVESLKKLIDEALAVGFHNIDIDASTLVDLSQPTELEQQRANFEVAAELANYVREHQPAGVTVSLGGEIGEVGKSNSRPEELAAFMQGFSSLYRHEPGLAKISIQTGSSHGGKVNPDGTVATTTIDFETIKTISQLARQQYQLGGAVQHGASTLPRDLFHLFPQSEAIEIHLATGFQNLIMDHPAFPAELLQTMYTWCNSACADERKPDATEAQFHYQARKKAWGEFKQQTWDIDPSILATIMADVEKECAFYFDQLGVTNTTELLNEWIKPTPVTHTLENYTGVKAVSNNEVSGLAD